MEATTTNKQRTNPQLDEIIARFDSEIAMFNDFKP